MAGLNGLRPRGALVLALCFWAKVEVLVVLLALVLTEEEIDETDDALEEKTMGAQDRIREGEKRG